MFRQPLLAAMNKKPSEHQEVLEAIEYAMLKTSQEEAREKSVPRRDRDGMRVLKVTTSAAEEAPPRRSTLVVVALLIAVVAAYLVWLKIG